MVVWGMIGNSHDASLAVFLDGKLVWASLAKDFSDVPNDPKHSWTQIEAARQSYGPPDKVVWYEKPVLKTLRQYWAGQGWLLNENNIKKYLAQWDIDVPVKYIQHHESHAAYGYYTSGKLDAYVMCLDSIGEFETLTLWHGKGNKLKKIYSQRYPHSVGLFYSAMTQRIGLVPQRDEYLVTEYAKKGDGVKMMHTMMQEIIKINQDAHKPSIRMRENLHRGCMWWRPELNSEQDMYDIAAGTQAVFEYCVKILSNYAHWKTNHGKAIAFAGGGALNKKAMDQVRKDWDNVWVPPNPGDPGSCIGAVLAQTKTKIGLDKRWYQKV